MSRNGKEWPLWKCATLTAALCGVSLVPMIITFPAAGLLTLIVLTGLYLGFVRLFGDGHVVEGAILVLILAVVVGILVPVLAGKNRSETSVVVGTTTWRR